MSLFTGHVKDKDGNAIDSKFKLFHVDTGKMSTDRDTEYQDFNIDSDDSDVNNGGAAFVSGNVALIACWVSGQCGIAKILGDGSDSYVFDIQMKDCQPPSTKLHVEDGIIDIPVEASNTSSDEYQWEYHGTQIYHKEKWFGQDWCDMVGIKSNLYDWGSGWSTDTAHTFDKIGDYLVKEKATNKCSLVAEDSKTIRIRYPKPSVGLVSDPASVIVGQETKITVTTGDPYSRVTKQEWFMDGKSTTELSHTFTKIGSHKFNVMTYWNDGFDNKQFDTVLDIGMKNQPPTIDMVPVPDATGDVSKWGFISNAKDPEDDLAYVKMCVYLDSKPVLEEVPPEEEYDWVQIACSEVQFDGTLQFYMGGRYRITMQAYDGPGLSSKEDEYVFVIPYDVAECPECPECPEAGTTTATGECTPKVIIIDSSGNSLGGVEVVPVNGNIVPATTGGTIEVVETSGGIEVAEVNGNIEAEE